MGHKRVDGLEVEFNSFNRSNPFIKRVKLAVLCYPFDKRVMPGLIFLIYLLNGSDSGWTYF